MLGLSWGTSLQAMVEAFSVDQPRSVEVVPLVGGLSTAESLVAGQELVRELAGRLGATYRYLHAPGPAALGGRARRAAGRAGDRGGPASARVPPTSPWSGSAPSAPGPATQILDGLGLSPAERKAFLAAGPVGDTCCRFFDAEGKPIRGVVHDRVLAIELDQLRAIPTVIGVATGVEKAPGVLGALRGGLVDGLVTDAGLALALLERAVRARRGLTGGACVRPAGRSGACTGSAPCSRWTRRPRPC